MQCKIRRKVTSHQSPVTDVSAGMRDITDRLAVTDMSMPPEDIWRLVRERVYLGNTDEVLLGLTREQVKRRVHRVRHTHYGGNYHGVVEVPPLSLTSVGGFPFFKFHQVCMVGMNLERVIGWAHPALHERLKCKNSSLFIDGTFRCVFLGFCQCIIFMVHDFATDLFLPVFFVLCTSNTQDLYWNVINAVVIACNEKLLPETVVCDFESALIDAVSVQFKDTRVVGCYFHFKQACKRYMETKVMIAMAPGFLGLLTVIPQHKIGGPGVRRVARNIEARCLELLVVYSRMKWEKFWRYFKRTWLTKYKPQDWNEHDIDKPLVSRTNYPLERLTAKLTLLLVVHIRACHVSSVR
ncbi:hypothetical protein P3T76_003753 [Phytophthora citrophthora]|uniref:MULE transposase domain-containing protein n=1 Tax=Phytophthora citrophthora TaxID=4793 RepID=A0AAD9GUM2_9STRA|nr:hypothetical protein P3T76_003753 [Phytophthora citrophthora]